MTIKMKMWYASDSTGGKYLFKDKPTKCEPTVEDIFCGTDCRWTMPNDDKTVIYLQNVNELPSIEVEDIREVEVEITIN